MTAYSYGRNNGCGREHVKAGPLCGGLVLLLLERETEGGRREAEKGGWVFMKVGIKKREDLGIWSTGG